MNRELIEITLTTEGPGPEPEAREDAEEWLTELLAAGPMPSDKVKQEAKAASMAWRTVERAKSSLGVKSEKCQFSGGWTWRLPKTATNTANTPRPTPRIAGED